MSDKKATFAAEDISTKRSISKSSRGDADNILKPNSILKAKKSSEQNKIQAQIQELME